jgi:hypothetical protein
VTEILEKTAIEQIKQGTSVPMPEPPPDRVGGLNYFLDRIIEMGFPSVDEAKEHGLTKGYEGSINIAARNYYGSPVRFIPTWTRESQKQKRYKKEGIKFKIQDKSEHYLTNRKTPSQIAEEKTNGGDGHKYNIPSKKYAGIYIADNPNNLAITNFTNNVTGGTILFNEGYFKMVVASLNDIDGVAFQGISVYQLNERIREYLLRRQPDNIVIMYDGDATDISEKGNIVSSKRVQDFEKSVQKFAGQLLALKDGKLIKSKIHFCMVSPSQPFKGLDDLILGIDKVEGKSKSNVLSALYSFKSSEYFEFIKLSKTSYEKKLKKFFSLNHYRQFYEKFKSRIGEDEFLFDGLKYQKVTFYTKGDLFNERKKKSCFKVKNDPHKITLDNENELVVNRYLSEVENDLHKLLTQYKKLAIEAPTGSAKTTFFLGYRDGKKFVNGYWQKNKTKGVITVPTVSLAKQLGEVCKDAVVLTGTIKYSVKEKALNSQIIICTYDTLHHVTDIENRVLVVDEAHNLINQYGEFWKKDKPFRMDTMRRVVELFEVAKQTILLSGTMPKQLCTAFGFNYLNVKRKENNNVLINSIEAENSKNWSLRYTLIASLKNIDYSTSKINFVLFDDGKQLEIVKSFLVQNGILKDSDIDIITREHIDNGDAKTIGQIINGGVIDGKKLILTTCILSEGISINNYNVGEVYAVGVNCPDKFRQWVARFRKMKDIEVTSILPPEKRISIDFKDKSKAIIDLEINNALGQVKFFQENRAVQLNDYDLETEMPFLEDIEPDYISKSSFLNLIYCVSGVPKVDILKILAKDRGRRIEGANNAYFYTVVTDNDNIQLGSLQTIETDENDKECVKQIEETAKDTENECKAQLIEYLRTDPSKVLNAYFFKLKKSGNRRGKAFALTTVGGLIDQDTDGGEYYIQNVNLLKKKWFTPIIRAFMKLHFSGMSKENIDIELSNYKESDFRKKWKSLEWICISKLYKCKRSRKSLTTIDRIETKLKINLIKKVEAFANKNGGQITTSQFQKIVNEGLKRTTHTKGIEFKIERIAFLKQVDCNRMINELFRCEVKAGVNDYTYSNVQKWDTENVPFLYENDNSILLKPLKMLDLYEKR